MFKRVVRYGIALRFSLVVLVTGPQYFSAGYLVLTLGFSLNQCLNLLKGRFKRASKVLDRKFENVRGKFQGCLKSVSESLKKN